MQHALGLDIPQTLEDICDPARLALIVSHMQIGIVKQIANGQEITDKVLQVLDAARKAGIRVIFTRHMSLPTELMSASQFRMAMAWQRLKSPNEVKPWFLRDAPGFHLIPETKPRIGFDRMRHLVRASALGCSPVHRLDEISAERN
jgi:biuret amidohydrolase